MPEFSSIEFPSVESCVDFPSSGEFPSGGATNIDPTLQLYNQFDAQDNYIAFDDVDTGLF
jgi:hypothetical protein